MKEWLRRWVAKPSRCRPWDDRGKVWGDVKAVDAAAIADWFDSPVYERIVRPLVAEEQRQRLAAILAKIREGGDARVLVGEYDGVDGFFAIETIARKISKGTDLTSDDDDE